MPNAPNLVGRSFTVAAPNQLWVGDISVPQKAA
jgi:transposase InsO family protein